jgi:hypothetical protein
MISVAGGESRPVDVRFDDRQALARSLRDPDYVLDLEPLLVRGTHWDHLEPTYQEYLKRHGFNPNDLPERLGGGLGLPSSTDGLSAAGGPLHRLGRYYEGYDDVLDLSRWHPEDPHAG